MYLLLSGDTSNDIFYLFKINTGAKYDSEAFKKSVGLNGVGTKAVNALASYFKVSSVRDEKIKTILNDSGTKFDPMIVETFVDNINSIV